MKKRGIAGVFRAIFSHWPLKLISILMAFSLWFVVVSTDNPVDDKTFSNIKVNLLNTELLEQQGKVYEVLDGSDVLRSVSFDAPQSVRSVIEAGDIIAEADLNDLTAVSTVPITFSCPKYQGQVTNISGSINAVRLNIENEQSRYLNITYNVVGEVAEGYLVGGISLDQNRLQVTGPESKVSAIRRAVVNVDVSELTGNMSTRSNVVLYDADNNEITASNVIKNIDDVRVTVDVYTVKQIPVEYEVSGEPAEGYKATGEVSGFPQQVKIAGPAAAVNGISRLTIPEADTDLTGLTGNLEKTLDLKRYLPSGLIFADSDFTPQIDITVYVEEIQEKQITLRWNNMRVLGLPADFFYERPEGTALPVLTVRGLARDIENLTESALIGTVDVAGWMEDRRIAELTPGEYTLPVEFELAEGQEQVGDVTVDIAFRLPEPSPDPEAAENADGTGNAEADSEIQ